MADMTEREAYDELCAYTLTRGDAAFVHQHVVDAFAAQTANSANKPMAMTFALAGLYLHVARSFTGKQVQQAHQYMARRKRPRPAFILPDDRGSIYVSDVVARAAGPARDEAIHEWCETVWHAFSDSEPLLTNLLSSYGDVFADWKEVGVIARR